MTAANKPEAFWIFGSGTFALEVYNLAISEGLEVLGIIDHDTAKFDPFKNISVLKLNLSNLTNLKNAPIYLGICNPYVNIHEISEKLAHFEGFKSVKTPVELASLFWNSSSLLERYWLSSNFELYIKHQNRIEAFEKLLTEPKSKALLRSILSYRRSGRFDDLPIPDPVNEQYLPKDLESPPKQMNIVEFGSCAGENLSAFLKHGVDIVGGYIFEPDHSNFQELTSSVSLLGLRDLSLLPLAAWSTTTQLRFNSSGNTDSAVSADGDYVVQAVCLDDVLPKSFEINYLKMDIEGAELEALKGAIEVIRTYLPSLAICVYHTPEHLWEIPLWVNDNFPGMYNFHLRTYAEQTFETVLYCIPV